MPIASLAASALAASVRSALGGGGKMVLVVRTDLGMTKGKMCAQVAHAAVSAVSKAAAGTKAQQESLRQWERSGSAKVVVRGGSEEELRGLLGAARGAGLVAALVRDAGHTQVEAGTVTVLAVGPGPDADVDGVTGQLKLL
jgi:peptidyl-tRNA hydrolase, PTH2 family